MSRNRPALLIVAIAILVAAWMLTRLHARSLRGDVSLPEVEADNDPDVTPLDPRVHTDRGSELATPLDPAAELGSHRSEARAIEPSPQSPKSFSTRRLGGSGRHAEPPLEDNPALREHVTSWCAIVGIDDSKTKDVGDVVLRAEQKWKSAVKAPPDADKALVDWRREELGRLVGYVHADALIAAIKPKLSF